jgi:hypothetical protein
VKAPETKAKEPVTFQKVMVRSITATLLSLFYLGLLQTGHLYCILSIVLIQVSNVTQVQVQAGLYVMHCTVSYRHKYSGK